MSSGTWQVVWAARQTAKTTMCARRMAHRMRWMRLERAFDELVLELRRTRERQWRREWIAREAFRRALAAWRRCAMESAAARKCALVQRQRNARRCMLLAWDAMAGSARAGSDRRRARCEALARAERVGLVMAWEGLAERVRGAKRERENALGMVQRRRRREHFGEWFWVWVKAALEGRGRIDELESALSVEGGRNREDGKEGDISSGIGEHRSGIDRQAPGSKHGGPECQGFKMLARHVGAPSIARAQTALIPSSSPASKRSSLLLLSRWDRLHLTSAATQCLILPERRLPLFRSSRASNVNRTPSSSSSQSS